MFHESGRAGKESGRPAVAGLAGASKRRAAGRELKAAQWRADAARLPACEQPLGKGHSIGASAPRAVAGCCGRRVAGRRARDGNGTLRHCAVAVPSLASPCGGLRLAWPNGAGTARSVRRENAWPNSAHRTPEPNKRPASSLTF
jgi:hypothetical protein